MLDLQRVFYFPGDGSIFAPDRESESEREGPVKNTKQKEKDLPWDP